MDQTVLKVWLVFRDAAPILVHYRTCVVRTPSAKPWNIMQFAPAPLDSPATPIQAACHYSIVAATSNVKPEQRVTMAFVYVSTSISQHFMIVSPLPILNQFSMFDLIFYSCMQQHKGMHFGSTVYFGCMPAYLQYQFDLPRFPILSKQHLCQGTEVHI